MCLLSSKNIQIQKMNEQKSSVLLNFTWRMGLVQSAEGLHLILYLKLETAWLLETIILMATTVKIIYLPLKHSRPQKGRVLRQMKPIGSGRTLIVQNFFPDLSLM
ncbi:hypothetical protein ILYODFUR_036052, partial [Ilyodon furcidens]